MANYEAWYRKYRPRDLNSIILPQDVENTITKFYNQGFVQGNILSFGSWGLGKTSVNDLLISKIIKNPQDLFVFGRKVQDVEDLMVWLKRPCIQSTQKVVKIEEMDKIDKKVQLLLKDGPLERYQDGVTFLATTNNPEKIEGPLLSRFNLKIHFTGVDPEKAAVRLMYILGQENIVFEPDQVKEFVDKNIANGMRELLNYAEIASVNGTFTPSTVTSFTGLGESEKMISSYIVYLVQLAETKTIDEVKAIIKNPKSDQNFFQYWDYTVKLLKDNVRLNYDVIYKTVLESLDDLTAKRIITHAYQEIESKPYKSMHLLSTMVDLLANILDQKGNLLAVNTAGIIQSTEGQ